MIEYFCMECKFFGGYDKQGNALCCKDETNPRIVSPYEVHNEMECFRMSGE